MSSTRNSAAPKGDVNLYCAQCNSQIGIFSNEWIPLTSSYGRPREKGMHFGTVLSSKTQVVPAGRSSEIAEGCLMAEVYCSKCTALVGQYCKDVPSREKQRLKDHHYYKLSRVYLKDATTEERVDPGFVDEPEELVRAPSARTSLGPPPMPGRGGHVHTTTRQSFPGATPNPRRTDTSDPGVNASAYGKPSDDDSANASALPDASHDLSHQAATDFSNRIASTNSRLSSHIIRTNRHESRLGQHDISIADHRGRIEGLEQEDEYLGRQAKDTEEAVGEHEAKIEEQAAQIVELSERLELLEQQFDELRRLIAGTPLSDGFERHLQGLRAEDQEVEALQDENRMLKARLQSAANVLSHAAGDDLFPSSHRDTHEGPRQTSRKRKRASDLRETAEERARSRRAPSVARIFGQPSLPSPEPSQLSPVETDKRTAKKREAKRAQQETKQRHSAMYQSWLDSRKSVESSTHADPPTDFPQLLDVVSRPAPATSVTRPSPPIVVKESVEAETPLSAFKKSDSARNLLKESPFRSSRPRSMLSRDNLNPTPSTLAVQTSNRSLSNQRSYSPQAAITSVSLLDQFRRPQSSAATPPARSTTTAERTLQSTITRPVIYNDDSTPAAQRQQSTPAREPSELARRMLSHPRSSSPGTSVLAGVQAAIQSLNSAAKSHEKEFGSADEEDEDDDPALHRNGDTVMDDTHAEPVEQTQSKPPNSTITAPKLSTTSSFSAVSLLNMTASPSKARPTHSSTSTPQPDPVPFRVTASQKKPANPVCHACHKKNKARVHRCSTCSHVFHTTCLDSYERPSNPDDQDWQCPDCTDVHLSDDNDVDMTRATGQVESAAALTANSAAALNAETLKERERMAMRLMAAEEAAEAEEEQVSTATRRGKRRSRN